MAPSDRLVIGASVLTAGLLFGMALEEWAHSCPKDKMPELHARCSTGVEGWDQYLTFDGKDYACLLVDKKHGKIKRFLMALPKGELSN